MRAVKVELDVPGQNGVHRNARLEVKVEAQFGIPMASIQIWRGTKREQEKQIPFASVRVPLADLLDGILGPGRKES